MDARSRLRHEMVSVGRRLYARGLVAASDGNLSARLSASAWLVTPAGSCLGTLSPDELLLVEEGAPVAGRPTSEWALHRTAYAARPDIGAILHAHPPYATALTLAGLGLTEPLLPEVVVLLGPIPTAPYATPSGEESARAIGELIREHDGLLLDRHGAVTVGLDLEEAYRRMEKIEHCAQIVTIAHRLGRVRALDASQVAKLQALRSRPAPGGPPDGRSDGPLGPTAGPC